MEKFCSFFTTILFSLLHSVAFLRLTLGTVDRHMLFPNQTLAVGQTLISQNQIFEVGFFSIGKSPQRHYLGIWYKTTPDVVAWVANRNDPITHSQEEAVVFKITGNRSLVINSGESIIWSASSLSVATNPVLKLLDTGNLVLVDDTTQSYLWQSFDYPTDTYLPGMKFIDDADSGVESFLTSWRNTDDPSAGDIVLKIENNGLPDMVATRGNTKIYRIGQWNGIYFSGGPRYPNPLFKLEAVLIQERLISIGQPYDGSVIIRAQLDTSGSITRYTMNAKKDKWNIGYTFPQDTCDKYGICGPNGICTVKTDRIARCQCFKGFAPKFQTDWDLQDWSGGCIRTKPLNGESGDGFLEVRGVKYPDMLSFLLNTKISLDQCKAECLKNSSCTAYANTYITDGGSGCVIWLGDLIDTKELTAPDSKQNIYIRVPVSVMKMATILQATNNFSTENMIGAGGFGPGSDCGRHGCCGKRRSPRS